MKSCVLNTWINWNSTYIEDYIFKEEFIFLIPICNEDGTEKDDPF